MFFRGSLASVRMDQLIESLEAAPVVDRNGYQYFVHPVTDGLPQVDAPLLREIAEEVQAVTDIDAVDKILTAEAMGIHLSTAVTLATDVPFVIARKRSYGFDGEVAVHQQTGYSESELYINHVGAGDRLLILDDVLATGNTLAALTEAVEACGAVIKDIVVVIKRSTDEPVVELPVEVTALVEVDVVEGRVAVLDQV